MGNTRHHGRDRTDQPGTFLILFAAQEGIPLRIRPSRSAGAVTNDHLAR